MREKALIILIILLLSNQNIYSQYAGNFENEKQLSPDKKYCIYRSDIGYVLMDDEKFEGTRLLKANEDRNKNKGFDLKGLIGSWKSNDTLQIFRFDKSLDVYKDTLGRISYEKYYDLTVKVKTYHSLNAYGFDEYEFGSYKITKNQIIIHGVKKVWGDDFPQTIRFPLGGIEFNIENGEIESIMVSKVKIKLDYEIEMGGTLTKKKKASISYKNLYFYPKKKIKVDSSNLTGVFLRIE